MQVDLVTEDDGCVRITVEVDNMRATGWCSSHHLVDPKVNQLKAMIERSAAEALIAAAQT